MVRKSQCASAKGGLNCPQVSLFPGIFHFFFMSLWFCVVTRAEEMPEVCTAMTSQHLEKHFVISVLSKSWDGGKSLCRCSQLTVKEQLQSADSHRVAILINVGQIPPAARINTLPLSGLPCRKQQVISMKHKNINVHKIIPPKGKQNPECKHFNFGKEGLPVARLILYVFFNLL